MRRILLLGWPLLAVGIALVWLGLYAADSLPLVQSAVLHFIEHMQMMWDDMSVLPKTLIVSGVLVVIASLGLFVYDYRRRANSGEWY